MIKNLQNTPVGTFGVNLKVSVIRTFNNVPKLSC